MISPYCNLPSTQRRAQHIVTQFNAAEELWRSLEGKRLHRRDLYPDLSSELQTQLDLLDFANAQPPQDCVGFVEHRAFEPNPALTTGTVRSGSTIGTTGTGFGTMEDPKKRKIGFLVEEKAAAYGRK